MNWQCRVEKVVTRTKPAMSIWIESEKVDVLCRDQASNTNHKQVRRKTEPLTIRKRKSIQIDKSDHVMKSADANMIPVLRQWRLSLK